MSFAIATWNCRQKVNSKSDLIRDLGDVVVVPECSMKPRLAENPEVDFRWKGSNTAKGLGVFAFNGWTFQDIECDLPWALPVRVLDDSGIEAATLIAIWTLTPNPELGLPSYVRQLEQVIDRCLPLLDSTPAFIAGDFNASAQTNRENLHLKNVDRLEHSGFRSTYHVHNGLQHGDEPDMTLRWVGPGSRRCEYYCDFVFASDDALERLSHVEIGTMANWVKTGLSDHCPVKAQFATTE